MRVGWRGGLPLASERSLNASGWVSLVWSCLGTKALLKLGMGTALKDVDRSSCEADGVTLLLRICEWSCGEGISERSCGEGVSAALRAQFATLPLSDLRTDNARFSTRLLRTENAR